MVQRRGQPEMTSFRSHRRLPLKTQSYLQRLLPHFSRLSYETFYGRHLFCIATS
jgi:hypothetical protein